MTYANINLQICDLDGDIVSEYHRQSHSFTNQFGQFLYSIFTRISQNITDVTGAVVSNTGAKTIRYGSSSYPPCYGGINCYAKEGQTDAGIVVGGDATAFTLADYKMAQQITHGILDGQLFHSKVDWVPMVTVNPTEIVTTLHRSFMNMSPATVTVSEVGIIGKNTGKSYLLLRDVVQTQSILVDQILNVDVEFRTVL